MQVPLLHWFDYQTINPKLLKYAKNENVNKNLGCPGKILLFAFLDTYMYLVSKNNNFEDRYFFVN